MTTKERVLVKVVETTMEEVRNGNPLKDFMNYYEIYDALELLVKLAKERDDYE